MQISAFESFSSLIDSYRHCEKPSLRALWRTWQERASSRTSLLELDDRLLKDIGISRDDALREGQRPFWQGDPASYMRYWGGV